VKEVSFLSGDSQSLKAIAAVTVESLNDAFRFTIQGIRVVEVGGSLHAVAPRHRQPDGTFHPPPDESTTEFGRQILQEVVRAYQCPDRQAFKFEIMDPTRRDRLKLYRYLRLRARSRTAIPDAKNWITCPHCGTRFAVYDSARWLAGRHLSCLGRIRLPGVAAMTSGSRSVKRCSRRPSGATESWRPA
jgi:DNA-binding cell septation regulator SpoVG